jgi:hypothetical protein
LLLRNVFYAIFDLLPSLFFGIKMRTMNERVKEMN